MAAMEDTTARRLQQRGTERGRRVAQLALVASCVALALQLARVFLPIVFALGERSGTTGAAIRAGLLALALSLAPALAPLFPRLLGGRRGLLTAW